MTHTIFLCLSLIVPHFEKETFQRTLSTKGVNATREQRLAVTSFLLNSVSRERLITKPRTVGDQLLIDLRDYRISPVAWDRFVQDAPPGVPVDWFIAKFRGEEYYRLLGVHSLDDFQRLVRPEAKIAEVAADEMRAVQAAGRVAVADRLVSRKATLNGYLYEMLDNRKAGGAAGFLENLFAKTADQHAYLGSLPNGLIAYALADRAGVLQTSIDPAIAIDPNCKAGVITVGASCIGCHTQGVQPFTDEVRGLLKGNVGIVAEPKVARRLEDLFGSDFNAVVRHDQKVFGKAVENASGMDAGKTVALFQRIRREYAKK